MKKYIVQADAILTDSCNSFLLLIIADKRDYSLYACKNYLNIWPTENINLLFYNFS